MHPPPKKKISLNDPNLFLKFCTLKRLHWKNSGLFITDLLCIIHGILCNFSNINLMYSIHILYTHVGVRRQTGSKFEELLLQYEQQMLDMNLIPYWPPGMLLRMKQNRATTCITAKIEVQMADLRPRAKYRVPTRDPRYTPVNSSLGPEKRNFM